MRTAKGREIFAKWSTPVSFLN